MLKKNIKIFHRLTNKQEKRASKQERHYVLHLFHTFLLINSKAFLAAFLKKNNKKP